MLKDFIIIGGGPAGNTAALEAAQLGAKSILLVERDAMGGTCTNRGCIPSKFYLSRSERLAATGAPSSTEWAALLAHKRSLVQGLSRSIEANCRQRGVEIVPGIARVEGGGRVVVAGPAGETLRYESPRILIAAGSEPAALPGVTPDGERILTSTDALELPELPASLVVIGSGAVGSEFATIFRRFGVTVTIVEAAGRLFPQEDPEVDLLFRKIYDRAGIGYRTGDPVERVAPDGAGVRVSLNSGETLLAEKALLGVGRILLTDGLGCEAAGVARGPRGEILVDEHLATSSAGVWAAGDATGRMLLAHAASYQGAYAARRAFGAPYGPVPYGSIPWATYTQPEVASVGLTEEGARRAGVDAVSASRPLMESIRARIDRSTEGFFKLVAERGSGRVVGGTVVGPHASELIHIVAMAIHAGLDMTRMDGFCFAHPSVSEVLDGVIDDLNSALQ